MGVNETVQLILSLSLSGSILAALLFLLKPLIKKRLAKSIQYYLWLLVLLRLLIPFSFDDSLMNRIFYDPSTSILTSDSGTESPAASLPGVEDKIKGGVYNQDTDHNRYLNDLLRQDIPLFIWLLGFFLALAVHLIGYLRFWSALKKSNRPALEAETRLFHQFWSGSREVQLFRNPLVNTPMLVGVFKPSLIIPEHHYDEKQLHFIVLHELTHLRRFDIAVKWLIMIVASVHWFNPLVYFIKKEINHACELACDEAVIHRLGPAERQAYGETLLSMAAENRYPLGVLQATMSEEKETLKERLLAILKFKPKSRISWLVSFLLLLAVAEGSLLLGACTSKSTPQVLTQDQLYQNHKYGFAITLPQDFAEAVEIKDEGDFIYFVDKEIQKTEPQFIFGVVGRIEIYDKSKFSRDSLQGNEDAYGLRILGENEKYYFGWAHATDVQLPPQASEASVNKYRAMEKRFNEAIKTFTIKEASA